MTKNDFVKTIASKLSLSNAKAGECLDVIIGNLTKLLSKGDSISFTGFGTFSVKKRAARKGRNPKTGEEIKISARKVAHFSAGKGLKDLLNKK
jgi:DNA-binding protein HU-beta